MKGRNDLHKYELNCDVNISQVSDIIYYFEQPSKYWIFKYKLRMKMPLISSTNTRCIFIILKETN